MLTLVHPSSLRTLAFLDGRLRPVLLPVENHRHRSVVAAIQRVALASAAGGGGWPLSGGWKGLEARGGAQRAREWALEAARPPAPAISEPGWISESGCSSERPREASSPGDWGHLPDACLDSPALPVLMVALVGLVHGLAADPQGLTDLAPSRSVASCSCGQKIACNCEVVLGVSHGPEGVQGPLWAALSPGQVLDGPPDAPACLAAFFRTHVNGYCSPPPTESLIESSGTIDVGICDTAFLNTSLPRVAPIPLIRFPFPCGSRTEKERPRAAATAGVVDGIRCN